MLKESIRMTIQCKNIFTISTSSTLRYLASLIIILTVSCTVTHAQNTEWLKEVAVTTRISAQHYSEMVCDGSGNVYIASYVKDTTRRLDFIYIVKVDANGNKIWEKGIGQYGRAVSISIDDNERIWVTGYFVNRLTFDDKHIKCQEVNAFYAAFNKDGSCLTLQSLPEGTDAHNIHVNIKGDILFTGTYGYQLEMDKLAVETDMELSGFICIVDNTGKCKFLSNINGTVHDVYSDTEGAYYLTGSFADEFEFGDDLLYTQSYLDKDGFVMKLNADGEMSWLNQVGKVGAVSEFYTSHDAGCDLTIQGGRLLVPVVEDSTQEHRLLYIHEYDLETGDRTARIKIASGINAAGGVSIEAAGFTSYLTFVVKDNCIVDGEGYSFPDSFKLFIVKLDEQLKVQKVITGNSPKSSMFRESIHNRHAIYFSGHYQKSLQIKKHSLKNSTPKNVLFLYKVPFSLLKD